MSQVSRIVFVIVFQTFVHSDEETRPESSNDNDKDQDNDRIKYNPRVLWHLRHWLQIFFTWKLRVTLDSIRNSCDVFFLMMSSLTPDIFVDARFCKLLIPRHLIINTAVKKVAPTRWMHLLLGRKFPRRMGTFTLQKGNFFYDRRPFWECHMLGWYDSATKWKYILKMIFASIWWK